MQLKLSAQEAEAVAVFDNRARAEVIDDTPLWVDRFSQCIFWDLPGSGLVVDIGCGTGRAVGMLHGLGIEKYLGIDPSADSIALCRRYYPDLDFAVGSIQTLGEDYKEQFSGFLLITTLMHVPRKNLKQALTSLRASLITGAQGMISVPTGPELTWRNKFGMTITLYTIAEMEKQLPAHGLSIRQLTIGGHMLKIHVQAT